MSGSKAAFLMLGLMVLVSCGGEQETEETAAPAAASQDAAPAGGMEGMPGMEGGQGGMMDQMTAHMQMMQGVSADSMTAMMPMHRQMVGNMIARFNRDMTNMNMTGDSAWTATVDSLRSDLTRMPEMSAAEMQEFMPAHHARVMRLMEMHRGMMQGMGM